MDKIIYFPKISFSKSGWLTISLLYWDKIASIVPYDFIKRPSMHNEYMRRLVEAELVQQIIPEDHLGEIDNFADRFLEYIDGTHQINDSSIGNGRTVYKIHTGKLDTLGHELEKRGLYAESGWTMVCYR